MTDSVKLKRSLSLTQMVLYGVGTTVGAGIYALIGEIAGVAGHLAPWSFVMAAGMAAFTAFSFARLSARYPRAAGAALYVQLGMKSRWLGRGVGLLAILAGIVSAAALLNAFVGYLQPFVPLDRTPIIVTTGVLLCAIAAWGIGESVWVAGVISVVEVLGLLWVTSLAFAAIDPAAIEPSRLLPDASLESWSFITTGAMLAFYAYIGFEDMIEVAEEVRDVSRNLPRAIFLTLGISTLVYVLLVTSTLLATGPELLARSSAPLADVYRELTGVDPVAISIIGLFAIINGALIQLIMVSRVLYGLSARGQLPRWLARVDRRTRTPLVATLLAGGCMLVLALMGNLASLAEATALIMLGIFALVNLSLCRLSWREARFTALVGLAGAILCAGFVGRSIRLWLAG